MICALCSGTAVFGDPPESNGSRGASAGIRPRLILNDDGKTLTPTGRLVLAVPDRRRCFDFFRPASTTGAVLQAHLENRTRHIPGNAFDFIANFATLDGRQGAGAAGAATFALSHAPRDAKSAFDLFVSATDYQDCHAWVFTPSSFRLIASDLAAIGSIGLREEGFR